MCVNGTNVVRRLGKRTEGNMTVTSISVEGDQIQNTFKGDKQELALEPYKFQKNKVTFVSPTLDVLTYKQCS
jgi:hypothetical protein